MHSSTKAESDEDGEENFDKDQRTTKSDDLDHFAKLMKHKIDNSLELILARFNQLVTTYEAMSEDHKNCEKQLTFMVNVVNSLFSYGLPTTTAKTANFVRKDGEMTETTQDKYVDFQII